MNTTSADFVAGPPHRSGPIRAIARPFGPIASRVAGTRWFPLWAILRHTGRTSGTAYATPVVALHTPDGFLIPLPFGDATQWAKNLFSAGGGSIRSAGREHRIVEPRIIDRDAAAAYLPLPLRSWPVDSGSASTSSSGECRASRYRLTASPSPALITPRPVNGVASLP